MPAPPRVRLGFRCGAEWNAGRTRGRTRSPGRRRERRSPPTQNVTAAVSSRMRGSSEPRTAIQAAAGAMPKRKSQNQMGPARKALGVGVEQNNGERHRGKLERETVQLRRREDKIAQETTTKLVTNVGDRVPAGSARVWVRGLAASMEASATRLNAMAAERAEIMATMIHASCRMVGRPPAASIAPHRANGRAKMECSHLIISSVTRRLRNRGTSKV